MKGRAYFREDWKGGGIYGPLVSQLNLLGRLLNNLHGTNGVNVFISASGIEISGGGGGGGGGGSGVWTGVVWYKGQPTAISDGLPAPAVDVSDPANIIKRFFLVNLKTGATDWSDDPPDAASDWEYYWVADKKEDGSYVLNHHTQGDIHVPLD